MIPAMVGVPCGVCGDEAFQVKDKEAFITDSISVTVKCCPRCVRRIDADAQSKIYAESLKLMNKTERMAAIKERSREWADSFDGKQVTVYYNVSDGRGGIEKSGCRINGVAHRLNRDSVWGSIRVEIGSSELHRISYARDYYWEGHKQVFYQRPIVDGFFWGLFFPTYGYHHKYAQPLCFEVRWGERDYMRVEMVEEVL